MSFAFKLTAYQGRWAPKFSTAVFISGCFFDDFVDFCGPLMSETHRLQFVHFRRRSVLRGLWELR